MFKLVVECLFYWLCMLLLLVACTFFSVGCGHLPAFTWCPGPFVPLGTDKGLDRHGCKQFGPKQPLIIVPEHVGQ
jgi:hypothetical protein